MLRMMGGSPDSHEHDHMDARASHTAREDGPMDQDRARSLLIAERDEVQGLLKDAEAAGRKTASRRWTARRETSPMPRSR